MNYRFIDIPIPVDIGLYEKAIDRMLCKIVTWPYVKAIYQIGGITTPGISDLDMVVVFEDSATCLNNPRLKLSSDARYIFAHSLYGVSLTHFRAAQNYSFFHNYKLLWGSDIQVREKKENKSHEKILKIQIALEYLVRLYINLIMQRVYRVYKLRELFLHIKAVCYDLNFLEISTGRLWETTRTLIDVRNGWFEARLPLETLERLLDSFFESLVEVLRQTMNKHPFYLARQDRYTVGRVVELKSGQRICYRREGMLLPDIFSLLIGRRYFNLQNRLNSFVFELPFSTRNIPEILNERYRHIRDMKEYNFNHLFHFDPLTTSLDVL